VLAPRILNRILPVAVAAGLLVVPAAARAASKTPVKATIALGDKRSSATVQRAKKKVKAKTASVPCANTDVVPTAANADVVRAAILCLHNQVRVAAGLPTLKDNAKLDKAALGHSGDMVSQGYFDHTEPDGNTFVDRILGSGYVKSDEAWALGENLAWGTGDLSTPAGVMNAWMNSAGHKANILKKSYREVGIGIRVGVPSDAGVGATITADFGAKL
jgi:uncharacterized protein YkwD